MIKRMQEKQSTIELVLGVTLTAGEYALAKPLSVFLNKHPEMNMHIIYGNAEQLLAKLDNGEIHFALIEGYFPSHKYEQLLYYTDSFICVCAKNHTFSKKVNHIEDLLNERILIRETGSGTRDLLDSYLKTYNLSYLDFKNHLEIESISSIISLLKNDCGISFLYRLSVEEELKNGSLKEIKIQNLQLHHDTTFLWNKNSVYSKQYKEICKELIGGFN